jgi:hypothetical protein
MKYKEVEVYAIGARYADADGLKRAAEELRRADCKDLDAYSPYPVEGLGETVDARRNWLPPAVLIAGFGGAALAYLIQWWSAVYQYPVNIGGRPLNSWPAFIPVTVSFTLLIVTLSTVVGMLLLTRLPALYHPIFNAPEIERVTQDGFFLYVRAADEGFDPDRVRQLLLETSALEVIEVPRLESP